MLSKFALLTLAAVGAWLSLACYSDDADSGATATPEGVVLGTISPASGVLGAEVVLRGSGFTPDENDVAFTHEDINFQGSRTGYLNGLPSSDGTTLRLNLPDNDNVLLAACSYSQLGPNEACPDIGLLLPFGEVKVSVVNANGETESVTLTVLEEE